MHEEMTAAEEWVIDDDSKAEWALRKILEAYDERDRLLALVQSERDRLDKQEQSIQEKCRSDTAHLEALLREYMGSVKTRDTAAQSSYKLLSGTLVYKKPKTDIAQGEELLAWLEKNRPELVRVKKEAAWSDVKKAVSETEDGVFVLADSGEVVEGIEKKVIPGEFMVRR